MTFRPRQFLESQGLEYTERHKHVTRGWVGIACPFCSGNPGYHGGFNIHSGHYHCWRCGGHPVTKVIAALLGINWTTARALELKFTDAQSPPQQLEPARGGAERCEPPAGCGPLGPKAQQYLIRRGFDPERLSNDWGLLDSGTSGPYRFRIIAPVIQDGRWISYVGRDYTGRQPEPYKSCSAEREVFPHKNTLYGLHRTTARKTVVVVEGAADVWRLGPGCVATFGVEWTVSQAVLLAQRFERVFIMYDDEDGAQSQAEGLWRAVVSFCPGMEGEILRIPGVKDPGELSERDAGEITSLLFRESVL